MEKLLSILTILAMINDGYMAPLRRVPICDKNIENKRILDIYHGTSPLRQDHENRMRDQLPDLAARKKHTTTKITLRKQALYLIAAKCRQWEEITGWNQEKTDKQLAWIYRDTMTGEPDQEGRMCERLKRFNPIFQEIDPEIIRSVVHNWYRHHANAARNMSTPQQRIALNREVLDVYHGTFPFDIGQEQRMNDVMEERTRAIKRPRTMKLRKHAQSLIQRFCGEWEQITGWNQKETDERLSQIYPITNMDEPIDEAEVREKLLEAYPQYRNVNPEIIRSVIHKWNTQLVHGINKSGLSEAKKNDADLLHIHDQVKYGQGKIHDRVAEKWKQLHPDSRKQNKYTLLDRVYHLARIRSEFSSEEMEEAKKRYERAFAAESRRKLEPEEIKRTQWSMEQKIDVMHLHNLLEKEKLGVKNFWHFWRAMHPELDYMTKDKLLAQVRSLKMRNFHLTKKDTAVANARLKEALLREEKSFQDTSLPDKGKALAIPDEEQFLQRSPDAIMQLHSRHAGHDFIDEDREYSRTLMKNGTSNYPPTPRFPHLSYHHGRYSFNELSRAPRETSFSHVNLSSINPLAANPYYEHGSSSHDPHTANPYYEHGSSSDSRDDYHPS